MSSEDLKPPAGVGHTKPSFYAMKMWEMVDTCSRLCPERLTWNEDGDGFTFQSTKSATQPCPELGGVSIIQYFFPGNAERLDPEIVQRRSWEKLARQFNNYRIDDDGSQGLKRRHAHGLFRRGRPDLVQYILRSSVVRAGARVE